MTIMIIIAIIISIVLITISYLLTHKATYPRKVSVLKGGAGGGNNIEEESRSQYECGIEILEGPRGREKFYIKFYIIAIIFLIFDLESVLLYPATILFTKLLRETKAQDRNMTSSTTEGEGSSNLPAWELNNIIGAEE